MAVWGLIASLVAAASAVRSTPQMSNTITVLSEGIEQETPGSAKSKLNKIWYSILEDEGEPGEAPWSIAPLKLMSVVADIPILGHFLKYFFEDLTTTFSWRKDVGMPPGHTKAIHPIGSVALVKLLWDEAAVKDAGYTGVFKTNQENALIRIGPAGAPKSEGMAPGAALKVFRDGQESVNTFMLYSLRGQKGFNQFEHMLCNHLSDFGDDFGFAERQLVKSFKMASIYPFATGLSQWAQEPDLPAEKMKFPFVLCLRPVDEIRSKFAEYKTKKFEHIQDQLGLLNKTDIYDIYAAAEPNTTLTKIGVLNMRTPFVKTKFGDTKLFFRHDWFENDLMRRPDWAPVVDDEDFWFKEGANRRYSDVDPGPADDSLEQNAWVGGYNPTSVNDMVNDAKKGGEGSLLQTNARPRCPMAYLHQGDNSFVQTLLSR